MTPDETWLVRFADGRSPQSATYTNARSFIEQLPDAAVHGGIYTVKTAGGRGSLKPAELYAVPEFGVPGHSVVCTVFEDVARAEQAADSVRRRGKAQDR